MKYKKLVRYFVIVGLILAFRYFFSVLVNYTFPYREWSDGGFVLKESKSIRDFLPSYDLPSLWGRWDTSAYVSIAQNGYDSGAFTAFEYKNWAFFPLYPVLIKSLVAVISVFTGGAVGVAVYLYIGLVVANVCFAFALYFFDELLDRLNFSDVQKIVSLGLLLTFPAGYFYTLVYTESLFLFLSCLFLHLLFAHRMKSSAFILGLLLATRFNSIVFLPLFVIWFLVWFKRNISFINATVSFLLLSLPITSFLFYMKSLTGEYLAPIEAQAAWNNYYKLFGVFITYLKIYGFHLKYEFILSIVMLLSILCFLLYAIARYRKIILDKRREILILIIHGGLFFLLVSGVTNITSIFRYMSTCVSLFILLPLFVDPKRNQVFFTVILTLGLFFQSLFFVYFLTNSHVYGF